MVVKEKEIGQGAARAPLAHQKFSFGSGRNMFQDWLIWDERF